MPIPMALAATFDPEMARRYADVVANEVKDKGNDVVFAPTVNIMRTPLGGRTFEGFGEDPFLVTTAVAWTKGAQAQGVMVNIKHFAANNQEGQSPGANQAGPASRSGRRPRGDRFASNSVVGERTLREIYLPQFEAAVKEGHVASVMCSYNRLDGQYACENAHLLSEILKREWGFKGYVLADYGAAHDTVASLNNGLDFEPWPGLAYGPTPVNAALSAGLASTATIDDHVRRILRTMFAYGFLDRAAFKDDDAQIDKPAHARTSEQVEESAITLLKNSGALPLDAARLKSLAVIGSDADTFKTGGGSGAVTPFSVTTPRQAITDRAGASVKVNVGAAATPRGPRPSRKGSDVDHLRGGDYETEGADRQCLTLECPNYNGDPGRLIDEWPPQARHDRRAGDGRTRIDAVATG